VRRMKCSASVKLLSQIEVPRYLSWGSSVSQMPVARVGSEWSKADAGAGGEHPPPAHAEGSHLCARVCVLIS